jgi:hypothetical protein
VRSYGPRISCANNVRRNSVPPIDSAVVAEIANQRPFPEFEPPSSAAFRPGKVVELLAPAIRLRRVRSIRTHARLPNISGGLPKLAMENRKNLAKALGSRTWA